MRSGGTPSARITVILLAAGAGRRMAGVDKLLAPIDGQALLRHATLAALDSRADTVLVVLPSGDTPRHAALDGLNAAVVSSTQHTEGMAGSLRDGLALVPTGCDAVIIALADMPEVTVDHYNALIDAFDPASGPHICRATSQDGRPGHPVLFPRRFFKALAALQGDSGARDIIARAGSDVVNVPTPGRGALVDLDTPDAWQNWRALTRR